MGWRAASAKGRRISQSEDVSGECLQARGEEQKGINRWDAHRSWPECSCIAA